MKKFLLSAMAVAMSFAASMAQDTAALEFPESFGVTLSCEGPVVKQGLDQGVYTISVTGECEEDNITVKFAVPEGWDGYLCMNEEDYDPGIDPLGMKKAAAAVELYPNEWLTGWGFKFANEMTFKVDGEEHVGTFMLYKGESAAMENEILVEVNVSKKEAAEPVFPESFGVTLSSEGLEVEQGNEYGIYTITVSGECEEDNLTLTLAVPEGWDGFICMTDNDDLGGGDIEPYKMKKVAEEADWWPIDELLEMGAKKTNEMTFPIDGYDHFGWVWLYKGDQYDDANRVDIEIEVTKKDAAELVFPESFGVTLSCEGLDVEQGYEQDVYTINISGECEEDTLTMSLAVPEGWDGYICMNEEDFGGDIEPFGMKKAPAEFEWYPVDMLIEMGGKFTNETTFPIDGYDHYANFFLYKGDKVDQGNWIEVVMTATKKEAAEPVFPESFDVTLSSEGLEVEQSYEPGLHSITIEGECEENTVTVTLAVPEGWDGFLCMSEDEWGNGDIDPLGMKKAAALEPEWIPVDAMLEMAPGLKKANQVTFAVDGDMHIAQFYLYKGDNADVNNMIYVEFTVEKKIWDGVETVETADNGARYYNLQGVQIEKPENGVFVKVSNGKATKFVVK